MPKTVNPLLLYGNQGATSGVTNGISAAASGTFSANGNSTNKVFTIPHGLGAVPTSVSVEAKSVDALGSFVPTWDATNITITYQVAPATGSNNVVFVWIAIISQNAKAVSGFTTTSADALQNKDMTSSSNTFRKWTDADIANSGITTRSKLPSPLAYTDIANVFTQIQKINNSSGQQITFYRPDNTIAHGVGFYYDLNDANNAEQTYGNSYVSCEDPTTGAFRGDFKVELAIASLLGVRLRVYTLGNGGLIFGNNQRIKIDESGLTALRTFTLPDTTTQLIGTTDNSAITNKTI